MGGESLAAYAPPGYLLFQRQETVLAQAFQAKSLALAGEPAIVAEHVFVPSIDGSAAFSVSRNGTLAFRSGGRESTQLVWFDRNGKQISSVNAAGSYRDPALSPDGRRIAVNQLDPELNTWELWLLDLTRGAASRLTFDPGNDYLPVWSPDGTRIVFASDRGASGLYQLYTKLASGAGSEELLLESSSSKSPMDWSSDGRFIVYEEYGPKTRRDLWVLPLSGNRKPVPFLQTAADEFQGQFSPDGRWIAYGSDESGAFEIYVQPFPAIGGKWQISTGGGTQPRWRRDGKGLFYLADSRIMAVEVKTASSTFEAGIPRPLFPVRLGCCIGMGTDEFVPAADGQRFLVVNRLDHGESQPLTVVLNWMSELRTK
jgi:dipeptidyl aminopeptidase/acylaminoacyl peptidase